MVRLVLVAVAVGLSNFAASIGIGISGVDTRTRIRVAVVFGFFEAVMPIVGLLLGRGFSDSVGSASRWIGGGLLIAAGIYSFVRARLDENDLEPTPVGTVALIVTGAALSIDNLVAGFALGTQSVSFVVAAVVIAAVSVGMSLIGLELGSRLGRAVGRWSEEIGALVLVGVGGAIAAGAI